ncbi:tRNA1(Val) (adenine(37)-N6)-methyltransferase [Profundibacter sp.]
MAFDADDLSRDLFLGGVLQVSQPKAGYRAGVDPVLLAATVDAMPCDTVLELGCGAGVASLCLAARVPGVTLTGVEMQADYADLARRNAAGNGIKMDVHCADLRHLPDAVLQMNFDHVIANPPYYLRAHGSVAADAGREAALGEVTPLTDWINVATRRLKPKGYLTVIQDAGRLPALLAAIDQRLGGIKILPLAPRIGRPAHLVIVQARKGARAAPQLLAPVVMHEGVAHDGDRESYTSRIRAVLRKGAALTLSGVNTK